jgi:hypothetical protein
MMLLCVGVVLVLEHGVLPEYSVPGTRSAPSSDYYSIDSSYSEYSSSLFLYDGRITEDETTAEHKCLIIIPFSF